jgi:AraC-like DNA-binding protein
MRRRWTLRSSDVSRFLVTALISSDRLPRLAAALPPDTPIRCVAKVRDLGMEGHQRTALFVLDPLLFEVTGSELDRLLVALVSAAPVIVYTTLHANAMHRLQETRALIGAPLVIAGQDDGPDALRRALLDARITAHRIDALQELRLLAGPLPSAVDRAVALVFTEPASELSVRSLAASARLSPRTLERHLADVSAPSAQWLMRMARALLARRLLCSSSLTVEAVAAQVGYAKLESLRLLLQWSFGASPTSLRQYGEKHQPRPAAAPRAGRLMAAAES